MKQCPVCKSNVFDDMDTCYGCMYRFKESAASAPEFCASEPVDTSLETLDPEPVPQELIDAMQTKSAPLEECACDDVLPAQEPWGDALSATAQEEENTPSLAPSAVRVTQPPSRNRGGAKYALTLKVRVKLFENDEGELTPVLECVTRPSALSARLR